MEEREGNGRMGSEKEKGGKRRRDGELVAFDDGKKTRFGEITNIISGASRLTSKSTVP